MSVDLTKVAPWATDTPTLLTRTLTHTATGTVVLPSGEVITLAVQGGTVSFDETRAPRAQVTGLVCRLPTDQAVLDRIDPRTGARLVLNAGYARPDQAVDVQPLVDVGLRSRSVLRPDDTMTLTGASDEALLIDAADTANGTITNATTTGAITAVINQIVTTTPTVTASTGPAVTALLFEDRWDAVADLADQVGARVYDNGLRQWFIAPAPTLATPALELAVGSNGTIKASGTDLSRDGEFANLVWIRYEWLNGTTTNRIDAIRRVQTGPYAAVAGNYKIQREDRKVGVTQAQGNAAAAALVARTVTRGRSFTLTAISAYWLRPGMTVTVTLPLGDPEDHLVVSVAFDLASGTMRVITRLPDGVYTIGA